MEFNNTELLDIINSLSPQRLVRLTVSNKRNSASKFNKTVFRKISVGGKEVLQSESFTDKQCFHENIEHSQFAERLEQLLIADYKQFDGEFFTQDGKSENVSLKISKKGKILYNRKVSESAVKKQISLEHNRTKNYIIPEGTYVPALHDLGVITADGKVVNRMYDKWKQINRFAELVNDAVKNDKRDCFNIIDFGCGKSYLTFVLYYFFTEILGKRVNIVGLDLKKDVIDFCNSSAKKYGYDNLHFFCGDIKDYNADFKPDMVITLHACDTATDYALYNSVMWNADYIFSVPCCQHEVNSCIKANKTSAMLNYGIIKERLSALVTDTLRAEILKYCGYKAELLEFIDISHSPKNILIRAKRQSVSESDKNKILDGIEALREELCFEQTLYKLLIENKYEV